MTNEEICTLLKEHLTPESKGPLMTAIMETLVEKYGRTIVGYYCQAAGENERQRGPLFHPQYEGETPEQVLERAVDDMSMLRDGDNAGRFAAHYLLKDRPVAADDASVQERLEVALGDLALLEKRWGKFPLLKYLDSVGMR